MRAGPHDSLLLMPVYLLMHVLDKRTGSYIVLKTPILAFFGPDLTMHAARRPGNSDGIAMGSITNACSSN